MGFSRQEYWGGLPCPPPGDLPDPGMEESLANSSSWGHKELDTSAAALSYYSRISLS